MPILVLIGKRRDSGKDAFASKLARHLVSPHITRLSAPLKGSVFVNLKDAEAFNPKVSEQTRLSLIRLGDMCLSRIGRQLYAQQALMSFLFASNHNPNAAMIVPDWRYFAEYEYLCCRSGIRWDMVVLVWLRPVSVSSLTEEIDSHTSEKESEIASLFFNIEHCAVGNDKPKHVVQVVNVDYSCESSIRETNSRIDKAIRCIITELPSYFVLKKARPIRVYVCLLGNKACSDVLRGAGFSVVNEACNGDSGGLSVVSRHQKLSLADVIFADFSAVSTLSGIPPEMIIGRMQNRFVVSVVPEDSPIREQEWFAYVSHVSSVFGSCSDAIRFMRSVLGASCSDIAVDSDDDSAETCVCQEIARHRELADYGIQVGS